MTPDDAILADALHAAGLGVVDVWHVRCLAAYQAGKATHRAESAGRLGGELQATLDELHTEALRWDARRRALLAQYPQQEGPCRHEIIITDGRRSSCSRCGAMLDDNFYRRQYLGEWLDEPQT